MTLMREITAAAATLPLHSYPMSGPASRWQPAYQVPGGHHGAADPAAILPQQRVHLQGCLDDLLSEFEDTEQAIAAARQDGSCGAMSALQARLLNCLTGIAVVQAQLVTLEGGAGRMSSAIAA